MPMTASDSQTQKKEKHKIVGCLCLSLGELHEIRKKKRDYEAVHIPAASSKPNTLHPPSTLRETRTGCTQLWTKDSLLSRNLHSLLPRISLEHYKLPSIFT